MKKKNNAISYLILVNVFKCWTFLTRGIKAQECVLMDTTTLHTSKSCDSFPHVKGTVKKPKYLGVLRLHVGPTHCM